MTYLLDTDIISEFVRPRPDPNVVAWLASVDEERVYLSVVSVAEIQRGVDLLPEGARRLRLATWLRDDLPARFEGRLLAVDQRVAQTWGTLMAQSQRSGMTLGAMDAFLAATASVHGLILVTRNVRDFASAGISVLNPWEPVTRG